MSCCCRASRSVLVVLFGLALLAWVGCSSVPTQVNEGKIPARTFSFIELKAGRGLADERVELHASIQAAIAQNLEAKGLSKVEAGGDLTVAYLVIMASNATTKAVSDYFGYGPENAALLAKAHDGGREMREEAPERRIRNPKVFRQGALVVDVLDTRTLLLQYRNFVHRELMPPGTEEAVSARRLQDAVDEALADLRIVAPR